MKIERKCKASTQTVFCDFRGTHTRVYYSGFALHCEDFISSSHSIWMDNKLVTLVFYFFATHFQLQPCVGPP